MPPPTIAISPRGIPVRVSELADQGWEVHDPCGDLVSITKAFPVRNVQVVLDPGHGGKDPGTRGPAGLKESELNLKVALAVAQLLQDRNIATLMTRTGNYYIELGERIALADAAHAAAFISIHHNAPAAAKSNTPGTEVFAQTEMKSRLDWPGSSITQSLKRYQQSKKSNGHRGGTLEPFGL